MKNLAISLIPLVLGALLGSSFTKLYYERELTKIHSQYVKSIQEARTIEDKLREKANELEIKYQKDLEAVKYSNAAVVDKLRKQLSDSSSRVPKACKPTTKSDDSSRRARVSKELTNLIEFSEQCSRRLDESLVLNRALQNWIKESSK
jgi:hypothetical protein